MARASGSEFWNRRDGTGVHAGMLPRSIQISAGLILAVALTACGGTSVPTAVPATPPAATPSPSLVPATPTPATPAAATPAPAATATAKASKPGASSRPHPSASPDLAAVIGSNAKYFSSTLRLLDLDDGDLAVTVAYIDPAGGPPSPLATFTISPSGQQSDAVPPGTYRLSFHPSGSTTGLTCTITTVKGGAYTFIAIPGAIAVSRAGHPPTKAADLFIPTAPLCRT